MTTSQSSLFDGPGRVHRDAHDTEIAAAEMMNTGHKEIITRRAALAIAAMEASS